MSSKPFCLNSDSVTNTGCHIPVRDPVTAVVQTAPAVGGDSSNEYSQLKRILDLQCTPINQALRGGGRNLAGRPDAELVKWGVL